MGVFPSTFAIVMLMNSVRNKLKSTKPISSKNKLFVEAEKRHIQAHLALTELRLRVREPKNTANRQIALDILHDYWKEGVFPKNIYKPNERTPVFIDGNGTHCAVGYLMAETGYGDLANEIDRDNKFVLVEKLNNSKAEAWLNKYGLRKQEAALIQPGYGGFIIERVGYTIQDKILAAVTLAASLLLVAFVLVALRLLRNRTMAQPKKRSRLLQIAVGSALTITGLIFFLPAPNQAVSSLTSGATAKETITCGGFRAGELTGICREFRDKGGVPGWREVPCEGVCLL